MYVVAASAACSVSDTRKFLWGWHTKSMYYRYHPSPSKSNKTQCHVPITIQLCHRWHLYGEWSQSGTDIVLLAGSVWWRDRPWRYWLAIQSFVGNLLSQCGYYRFQKRKKKSTGASLDYPAWGMIRKPCGFSAVVFEASSVERHGRNPPSIGPVLVFSKVALSNNNASLW